MTVMPPLVGDDDDDDGEKGEEEEEDAYTATAEKRRYIQVTFITNTATGLTIQLYYTPEK